MTALLLLLLLLLLLQATQAVPGYKELTGVQCVIVGAGPVGLRSAVQFALMGADVTLIEKRNKFQRINILHLWDWACDDLAGT